MARMSIPHNIVDGEVRTVPGLVSVTFREGTARETVEQLVKDLGCSIVDSWLEGGRLRLDVRVPEGEEEAFRFLFEDRDEVSRARTYQKRGGERG